MIRPTVAFYAPLKPPTHPTPSGDRALARLLMRALSEARFNVELASRFRSRDGAGDPCRQARLRHLGERSADRLLRRYLARPPQARPQLWFTYHLYHKAPDWLGPRVSAALGIPYILAEASYAPKQRRGPWQTGLAASVTALRRAELILNLNPADLEGLRPLVDPQRLRYLPPFLDLGAYPPPPTSLQRRRLREALAARYRLKPDRPWLVCTAMMRDDAKLRSYALLARALAGPLPPHQLLVIGDGRARDKVQALFAHHPQVRFLGALDPPAARPILESCDLYVWPAVNEAFGLALLEAQACGLGVVAGREGGVPSILAPGASDLLVPPRDPDALAQCLRRLLTDPARLTALGEAARRHIEHHHSLASAAQQLRNALLPLLPSSQPGTPHG